MDPKKKTDIDIDEENEKPHGHGHGAAAGSGSFVHQCPFGNGDSYRQGIRWIQATSDRLVHLEEAVDEIKESGATTASRVEEVRQEIKFWARIVSVAVGVPAVVVAILKIISEFSIAAK